MRQTELKLREDDRLVIEGIRSNGVHHAREVDRVAADRKLTHLRPLCRFTVEGKVTLEPGKSYILIAGPRTKFGPIPFFTVKNMCALGIKDDESGKYLPIENFACSQTK